jgi:hypothetical protein
MRQFAIIGIAAAVIAIVSGTLVTASYKTHEAPSSSIDPTEITMKAQPLSVIQVNEPF